MKNKISIIINRALEYLVGRDRPVLLTLFSSNDPHDTFSCLMFAHLIMINPERDENFYNIVEEKVEAIITHETLHLAFWRIGEYDAMYDLDKICNVMKCGQWLV